MKVGILGANGFIGSRMTEMFALEQSSEPRPIVRHFAALARPARFKLDWRLADAFDAASLTAAFQGCETVVHSITGDARTILGTVHPVYTAAEHAGVRRIVYLSSASVYGQAPSPGTTDETPLPRRHLLPYNKAKAQAEVLWQDRRRRGNVEIVILRPGIVFGPRSRWTGGLADDLLGGRACLLEAGSGICNSVYVDNLVQAVQQALCSEKADGESFFVGDQEQVTWAEFYHPIAAALGVVPPSVPRTSLPAFRPTWGDRVQTVRSTRVAQSLLPWIPRRLKRAVKSFWHGWREVPREGTESLRAVFSPRLSLEMGLLQSCSYQLPSAKARRILNYIPRIPFDEACRRSIGWLGFAGYPILPSTGQ